MNKVLLYRESFLEPCLLLFKSNTPKFFDVSEEVLFHNFLIKKPNQYYVFFNSKDTIVATGGYEYEHALEKISLTWGMVGQEFHNQGYGTNLMEYRLKKIKKEFPTSDIILNTTQHTFQFYEIFGFQVMKITNNYYGFGLDRYDMIKISGPSRA